MKKYFFLLVLFTMSCDVPTQIIIANPSNVQLPEKTTSIEAIRSRVRQSETNYVKFSNEEDSLWIEAYVVSSDESGNFYKELYVQDQYENPTQGLRILIDRTALVDLFPMGRKVAILLNGLGAGFKSNVLTLGEYQSTDIGHFSQFLIDKHIKYSDSIYTVEPLVLSIDDFQDSDYGKLIQLNDVQFSLAEKHNTYSGEAFDEFDGERRLIQCIDYRSIWLSTSTFANFKSLELPLGSGYAVGILTRDYYGDKSILKINYTTDLDMHNSRCDLFFEESFETVPLGGFEGVGWTNYIQSGSKLWEVYEDENSLGKSIRLGSYRSGDEETISWLITPKMEISNLMNPHLAFRTSTSFSDSSVLEVFISSDWDGEKSTVVSSTWQPISSIVAQRDDDSSSWIDSGDIPLEKGHFYYVGFRYTGSGKTASDGTYELDDIRLFEKNF